MNDSSLDNLLRALSGSIPEGEEWPFDINSTPIIAEAAMNELAQLRVSLAASDANVGVLAKSIKEYQEALQVANEDAEDLRDVVALLSCHIFPDGTRCWCLDAPRPGKEHFLFCQHAQKALTTHDAHKSKAAR